MNSRNPVINQMQIQINDQKKKKKPFLHQIQSNQEQKELTSKYHKLQGKLKC